MGIPRFHLLATKTLTPVSLKDCSLVIDANNYFYDLSRSTTVNNIYGCDCNDFASDIRKKIHMFKVANVKCYFVFKGGDSDIAKKLKKFESKMSDSELFIFGKEIFKQVLDEFKINYSTCVTESKDECVALAKLLGCPVVSNDVDYCFKSVPYIAHLTKFSINKTESCIEWKQYTLQAFMEKYSMTEEKMAIFAVTSETKPLNPEPEDFITGLLKSWSVWHPNHDIKYKNLISWLSCRDICDILQDITKTLSAENNAIFLDKYRKKLENMRQKEAGVVATHLMDNLTIVRKDPEWFAKGVAQGKIPNLYINLYKWKLIFGTMNEQTSNDLMLPKDIIIYAYNLLTNYKADTIKFYTARSKFIEISTADTKIRRHRHDCINSVFENGWEHINNHKLFDWFLSENCINTKNIKSDQMEAMLIVSLVYFARKKKEQDVDVSKEVYCVIISYVMLNIVRDKSPYKKRIYKILDHDCPKAEEATAKHFKKDEQKWISKNKIDILLEMQQIILNMNNLNVICGSKYKEMRYHRMYNATLVFNLLAKMDGADSDVFITMLFKRAPSVLRCIKGLMSQFHDLL